jgi:hypothetical protein
MIDQDRDRADWVQFAAAITIGFAANPNLVKINLEAIRDRADRLLALTKQRWSNPASDTEDFRASIRRDRREPDDGYRWLNVGETLQPTDEYQFRNRHMTTSVWLPAFSAAYQTLVDMQYVYRRRIDSEPAENMPPAAEVNSESDEAPEPGYRWLEPGEVLQVGDEVWVQTKWLPTEFPNMPVPGGEHEYRRRIDPDLQPSSNTGQLPASNNHDRVRAAAIALYEAGLWVSEAVESPRAELMWQELRDALGLEEGHATDCGAAAPKNESESNSYDPLKKALADGLRDLGLTIDTVVIGAQPSSNTGQLSFSVTAKQLNAAAMVLYDAGMDAIADQVAARARDMENNSATERAAEEPKNDAEPLSQESEIKDPVIHPHHRLLLPGEPLRDGDEFWDDQNDVWTPITDLKAMLLHVPHNSVYRRLVNPAPNFVPLVELLARCKKLHDDRTALTLALQKSLNYIPLPGEAERLAEGVIMIGDTLRKHGSLRPD